ncbi:hypothetical protein [Pseudoramibacter porci]|uniref:Uncharacterized protein n=1 Tax=Pseudoramibacter porci TaxID=2606631 RepID=A0A7X2NGA0_9FIRM|nr:hypothetical protein [Pseudoramibacter porci]MSS19896.1 hypothetical protein [Pseudoramibacter porci]
MNRGETPTLTIEIDQDGLDLTKAKAIRVTFLQNSTEKTTKELDAISVRNASTLAVKLSQAETLALSEGTVFIQAKIKMDSDNVLVTDIVKQRIDTY